MTRAEWEAHQIATGLSAERAGEVADMVEYISQAKTGREIEDWLDLPAYLHRGGI